MSDPFFERAKRNHQIDIGNRTRTLAGLNLGKVADEIAEKKTTGKLEA